MFRLRMSRAMELALTPLAFTGRGRLVVVVAADAAIAVERYRRKEGKLPQRLDDLVPDFLPQIPTDPFDGRPLRYRVREEEYLIYSVGADRVDNGGHADPELGDIDPDTVFRVRRSP